MLSCVAVQVFMQTGFALEDPEVFNNVLPWNMVTQETKEGIRNTPRNSVKLLQEKVDKIMAHGHCLFSVCFVILYLHALAS